MALPDSPQTRAEQYLNAMATGNTSGLPATPQVRLEQYLDYIARNGGGSGLPEVTADDNDDVLTVVDGVWAKATPSGGGGGVLLVNLETDMTSMTMTMDKTWKELKDADLPVLVRVFEEPKYLKVYTFVLQVTEGDWEGSYLVDADFLGDPVQFETDNENGYPVYHMGN